MTGRGSGRRKEDWPWPLLAMAGHGSWPWVDLRSVESYLAIIFYFFKGFCCFLLFDNFWLCLAGLIRPGPGSGRFGAGCGRFRTYVTSDSTGQDGRV